MENETPSVPNNNSKMMPVMIVVAIVVIVAIAAIAFTMSKKPEGAMDQTTVPTQPIDAMEQQPTEAITAASYKDGEYEAEGMYTSPGGAESIDVTLTLKDGVVDDAEVVSNATRPISKQMQTSFIGGFKEQVVGKNIDEINLTKVSASSLAPKGFNDAVEKIKEQART